ARGRARNLWAWAEGRSPRVAAALSPLLGGEPSRSRGRPHPEGAGFATEERSTGRAVSVANHSTRRTTKVAYAPGGRVKERFTFLRPRFSSSGRGGWTRSLPGRTNSGRSSCLKKSGESG